MDTYVRRPSTNLTDSVAESAGVAGPCNMLAPLLVVGGIAVVYCKCGKMESYATRAYTMRSNKRRVHHVKYASTLFIPSHKHQFARGPALRSYY